MNQNLFVNFFDPSSVRNPGGFRSKIPPETAKRIHNEVLEHRLAEMESREEILDHLRAIHRDQMWRVLGYKSLQAFCKKELGYAAREAREIAITLGVILVSNSLKSDDRETQQRIEALRIWRRRTAAEEHVPAYRVFSNRTLLLLASQNPRSLEELKEVTGIGAQKREAFGEDVLRILRSAHLISGPHQPSLPSLDA